MPSGQLASLIALRKTSELALLVHRDSNDVCTQAPTLVAPENLHLIYPLEPEAHHNPEARIAWSKDICYVRATLIHELVHRHSASWVALFRLLEAGAIGDTERTSIAATNFVDVASHFPGRKPPFLAVKRSVRPYKTAIQN